MEGEKDDNFFIKKAKITEQSDPFASKAWILTAKSLAPNNFAVQFEVYKQEKAVGNAAEAAKCFSHIVLTFQNQPPELSGDQSTKISLEIIQMMAALRAPESNNKPEDKFYIEMFQNISYDVQNNILKSLKRDSESSMGYCQFVLLLLKRFPHMTQVHLPHLLEALLQNTSIGSQKNAIQMLLFEVVPLIIKKPIIDLSTNLVHRILTLGLEFYTTQIFLFNNGQTVPAEFEDMTNLTTPVCWSRIFEIVDVCGRILKWEPFLSYHQNWSKDVYWQKLFHIVSLSSTRPNENKQILFYGTILFVVSLYEYINNLKHKIDDSEVRFILVETITDTSSSHHPKFREQPPHIMINPPCNKEVGILFQTAIQCWQLLQSNEILQMDFKQLLLSLPCSSYVNQFLVDLAFFLGQPEEATTLLNDTTLGTSCLEKDLRHLGLTLSQPSIQIELLFKVISQLPETTGTYIKNVASNSAGRGMVFLPITKRAILQYCTKILVNCLKSKLGGDPKTHSDSILSCLLVLIQLNYPAEMMTAEMIFDSIRSKNYFTFKDFPSYIICPDFLEEFMYIYTHESKVHLELSSPVASSLRRIGTRGSDRGIKDEFKQLIRKQFAKSTEDLDSLIIQYITQARGDLIKFIAEN